MQFYLAVLDDKVREEGENPSLGMILCKTKNRTIVEYALRESNKPIGVAQYRIVTKLPRSGTDCQAAGARMTIPGSSSRNDRGQVRTLNENEAFSHS